MKLAPRMIQSMEILQMPLAELEERIDQELESNATLEVVEITPDEESTAPDAEAAPSDAPLEIDEGESISDFQRLESFEQSDPDAAENEFSSRRNADLAAGDGQPWRQNRRPDGERDAKQDAMASAPARGPSLSEQLREQWALTEVDESLRAAGELIIAFLDEDGYLRTDLETIADRAPGGAAMGGTGGAGENGERRPSPKLLEQALRAVQLLMDPPGVAARDARECLLLQIDAIQAEEDAPDPALEAARVLVDRHMDDLMRNRLPRIVETSGLSMDRINAGIARLRHLSLAPARRLVDDSPHPITPDAIVEYDEEGDRYIAYLNDARLPNLRINRTYAKMARDRSVDTGDRRFLRKNLSNAQWLIDALQQRKNTLLRVINVVIQEQRDYFDYGPEALRPLPMTQVADQLSVHVATVSRAVAGKYLLTPRGVVPLRGFFSGGTETDAGEQVSWDAIKASLKEIVDAEDKAHPLSDEALAAALKERGIQIARRTVAKYRDQLSIPSARIRKTF